MTPKTLKPVLAAALVAATLAPLAQAGSSTPTLRRGPDVMIQMPTLKRTIGRTIVAGTLSTAPVMKLKLYFNCASRGTPVEFPNDIAIWHDYNFTVAAGVKVKYVAAFGNTGYATLPAIPAGKQVFVSNVVPGGVSAETPCSASQI